MKIRLNIVLIIIASVAFTSCQSYKTIPYLQGLDSLDLAKVQAQPHDARVMPQDLVSIVVSCSNPELAAPFNLSVQTAVSVAQQNQTLTTQPVLQQYLVDSNGNIDFPVLGQLKIGGMTRTEVQDLVKSKLKPYIKEDPIVTVRLANFRVSVIGEVTDPGTYNINNEKVNIFEALALAKDMTVYGRRDNVHVIREDAKGHKEVATLNLSNANILKSPYYYLQQNDIVYVTPNKAKATTADITSSTTIWFSIVGSLMSLASIMIALFR
jgi:polysaccharide export outer membrane protein